MPPFTLAAERNLVFGLNVIGLRRAGFSAQQRDEIKRAFKLLYLSGTQYETGAGEIARNGMDRNRARVFRFRRGSAMTKRGVCPYRAGRAFIQRECRPEQAGPANFDETEDPSLRSVTRELRRSRQTQQRQHSSGATFFGAIGIVALQIARSADAAVVNFVHASVATLLDDLRGEIDFVMRRTDARTELHDQIGCRLRRTLVLHQTDRISQQFQVRCLFFRNEPDRWRALSDRPDKPRSNQPHKCRDRHRADW